MESLHCPMARFQSQAVLSALAAGSDVALVVNSGHSCTEIVPVYHGHAVHHAVQQVSRGVYRFVNLPEMLEECSKLVILLVSALDECTEEQDMKRKFYAVAHTP